MSRRTIDVNTLARVEGEGGLRIRISGDKVQEVQLRIFEPPRFFEALLRGRSMHEVPDITARICGICPVAYEMSSCHALEAACGVTVNGPLRELRRLLYCGEWIESHVLHAFLLHAPDFLGYPDAFSMAAEHGDKVQLAMRLKKIGNAIVSTVGGREIHPINIRLGGFYKIPELHGLLADLQWGQQAARDALAWVSTFNFPDLDRDYTFVALQHPDEYPLNEGRIVSSRGLSLHVADYEQRFAEEHVERSTALHSHMLDGTTYTCGPLARVNLNFEQLPPDLQRAWVPTRNPFRSIVARLVETAWAFDEAVRIVSTWKPPVASAMPILPRASTGHACTEAPRGILYHRYTLDEEGRVQTAKIVPPTSQNQASMEADLAALGSRLATLPHADATWLAEQAVRNYDPCISCSTHFLKLEFVK